MGPTADARLEIVNYNNIMITPSLGRASMIFSALAVLAGAAAANGDNGLAGAFGAMSVPLSTMAQLKTQSQRPVVVQPGPLDSDWDKTLAYLLKAGQCSTDLSTSLVTCRLDEVRDFMLPGSDSYSIIMTGRIEPNGRFAPTNGRLVYTNVNLMLPGKRVVTTEDATVSGPGILTRTHTNVTHYRSDGTAEVKSDYDHRIDSDSSFRGQLAYWGLPRLSTQAQSGRPVVVPSKSSNPSWDKALALVLNKGNCSTEPAAVTVTCWLEDHTGDLKGIHASYRINVVGKVAADGTFALTEALLTYVFEAPEKDPIAWRKKKVVFNVDGFGKAANVVGEETVVNVDGSSSVKEVPSYSTKTTVFTNIDHWARHP